MFERKTSRKTVLTFKQYERKSYSAFASLHREIRIGCLSVATLTMAHTAALASHADSLEIIEQNKPDNALTEVVVSGRVPVSLEQSASKVDIISREEIERNKVQSVNDLLKLCSSIDVRQRGAFGVQTDIGIGGGTFDQISILINGMNVNNPQTGHLTADFPVAIDDIERIEVYDGASARCFGSQALNGAINIITKTERKTNHGLHLEGGSYGTMGCGGHTNMASTDFLHRISADYLRSDGATHNSDFQKIRAFYRGGYDSDELALDWQAGYNYQRYGANTFYSASYPDQWERNNRIMASLKGHTKQGRVHLDPSLSWIRSYDHFQLTKNSSAGENFHRNDVFSAELNTYTYWKLGRTAFGGELRHEGILSTNLGKPLESSLYVPVENHKNLNYTHRDQRTNVSFFLEHMVTLDKLSLSLGAMANRNSAVNDRFSLYPGVDASYRPSRSIKCYASWNKSMRLPTFTDLYYKSPTQEGNVALKPEKMGTVKIGADFYGRWLAASVQGIYRRGSNMIDWVMYSADDIYHSTQFKLHNYELFCNLKVDFRKWIPSQRIVETLDISYMYNYQKKYDKVEIYKSNYALEYLRQKARVSFTHHVYDQLSATWNWAWQERMGGYMCRNREGENVLKHYSPYSLLDLKLNWTKPKYTIYVSMENLTNHTYYDYGSVPQPGFLFMAGMNLKFQ